MKVKQLIKELENCDDNMDVLALEDSGGWVVDIIGVRETKALICEDDTEETPCVIIKVG